MVRNSYRIIGGFLAAICLGALWWWLIDVDQVVELWQRINLTWIGPVILVMLANSGMAAYRLQLLTKSLGRVSVGYLWGLNFIGGVTSLLIPFQGGGFLRGYLLKKKLKSRFSTCMAVVVVDFFLGIITLVVFSVLAVIFFMSQGKTIAYHLPLGLVLMGVVAMLVVLKNAKRVRRWISWLMKKTSRSRSPVAGYLGRVVEAWSRFEAGLRETGKDTRGLFLAGGLSVGMFLISGLKMYLIFIAFGSDITYWPILFAGAIFGLSGLLPGTPLRLGQYELMGWLVFVWLLGFDNNLVAAGVLLSHILGVTMTLVGGWLAFWRLNIWPWDLKNI